MIRIKLKTIILILICSLLITGFGIKTIAAQPLKPILRDSIPSTMKLEGDITFTKTNPKITLSLRDSDVQQVLRMFADKAGLNIIFHDSVDSKKKITLDLVNVPINNAFKMVLQVSDFTYFIDDKTMIVASATASKDLTYSKHTMTAVPVTFLDASVIAKFLNKNIFSQNLPGLSNGDIVTTNPLDNELLIFGTKNDVLMAQKIIDKFDRKPNSTTFVLNHTTPKEMASLICDILLPTTFGKGSTGGATEASATSPSLGGGGGSGGGSTISLGGGVVACAMKEDVTAGSFSSFPTQSLTVAYFPQIGTINVIGGNKKQLVTINDFIKEHDIKQIQAYLEMAIVEANEDGTKNLTNTWNFQGNNMVIGNTGKGWGTLIPIFLKGDGPAQGNPAVKFSGPTTISWAVNYLMSNSKGRVLANPRILITNGQTSTLDMTSDYVKKVTMDMADASTGSVVKSTKNYEIASDLGLKLSITPHISPEGYITFNINPDYTTVKGQITNADGGIDGTLLARRNFELNNIRVKDGETLIIGGLIQETESKGVEKIPFLGDIPGVGFFFRSSSVTRGKSELVVMLTPRIIFDEEDMVTYKKKVNLQLNDEL